MLFEERRETPDAEIGRGRGSVELKDGVEKIEDGRRVDG